MQQALWFRTQAEDYLTLSQERKLTRRKKTLLQGLIAKTPYSKASLQRFKKDLQRLLAKRAELLAKRAKK